MAEIIQKVKKKRGRPLGCTKENSILKKSAMLSVLENTDLTQTEVAKAFNVTPAVTTKIYDNVEKIKKHTIQTSKHQKLASKAILDCLKGVPVKKEIVLKTGDVVPYDYYPDYNDRHRAAAMVLDRTEPKVTKIQSESISMSLEINPIDYSKYRDPIQDVVPTTPTVPVESTDSTPKQ